MAEFHLTGAQAAAVAHRGGALLISAGAGSGKTRVLVERLMSRIADEGLDADRFLLITYTRAAAAELRGRILDALHDRLARDPANRGLRRQTVLLRQAKIGTIHSLCADLLREHAHLAGIRPDFRQLEGAEETVLRADVLRDVLADRYDRMTEAFGALADTLGAGRDDSALASLVLQAYDSLQGHPDPAAWMTARIADPVPAGDAAETPWGALLLRRAKARTAFWLREIEAAADELADEPKLAAGYGPSFRGTAASLAAFGAALDAGWDAAAAFGPIDFPRLKAVRGVDDVPAAARVKELRERCRKSMEKVTAGFDAPSADLMADIAAVRPVTDELLRLVRDFGEAYAAEKRRRGLLDFADLEHLALRLLTEDDRETPSALALALSARYEEILVDEYQDCNPVQDRIFFALSRERRNVTMVGDVKQSIYRFRLADPGIFLRRYAAYGDDPVPGEPRRILLAENFRSDAGILRAANAFFSAVMSPELGEMAYGENEALRAPEGADDGGDEAVRFFVPEYGAGDRLPAEAEAAADYIAGLLRGGMTVRDGEGERPLRPGDVAILLRSAKGKDSVFAGALQRRGVPAVCPKSADSLEERPEVRWALSLLEIIDNPRQDIALLTALRSPVFAFSEDRLAEVRCFDRSGGFYEALAAAATSEADCRAVLRQMEDWRAQSRRLPADELLAALCAETGLYALAEAREAGSSANLDILADYARSFGRAGERDLFSFVNRLREASAQGEAVMTAAAAGGSGVVITTVHASKGLEYPVVVLADLMKKWNTDDLKKPLILHPALGVGPKRTDLDRGIAYPTLLRRAIAAQLRSELLSEELRILYVAMTRAKNRLALFLGVKDREQARAAYRADAPLPLPPELMEDGASAGQWLLTASRALGESGAWAWLEPPAPAEVPRPEAGDAAREEAPALAEELRARLEWRYAREADTRLPSKLTATALRATFAAEETAKGAQTLHDRRYGEGDFPPPAFLSERALSAAEKGTAMHLAMQYADLSRCDTAEGAAEAVAELRRRRLLTEAQADAVSPEGLCAFCRSGVMALLRRGELHREFKFSLLVPVREFFGEGEGETLLQGVIDLWSELPEGLVLVDYKTDRVTKAAQRARAEEYRPQLRAYVRALEKMTGKPVRRAFLWFFATGEAVELEKLSDDKEEA